MTPRNARRIIFVIWLFSLLITLPWALYFHLIPLHPSTPDVTVCVEVWPQEESGTYYFLVIMGMCYVIPLTVISICYIGIWIKVSQRSIPGETKGTNADVLMQRSKLKVTFLYESIHFSCIGSFSYFRIFVCVYIVVFV